MVIKMERSTANPIKEYYIAYLDILGYKAFFKEHKEDIPSFLDRIDDAIKRTVKHISIINSSPILRNIGSIQINAKAFSDNILLCMEAGESSYEPMRILAFLQVVSDIQRGFVTGYGLFLRGGIKRGCLSMNSDYVFGQGLIDVVEIEEKEAIYPRIIVDEKLAQYVRGISFHSQEQMDEAVRIANRIRLQQPVSDEDMNQLNDLAFRVQLGVYMQFAANNLIWRWDDGLCFVNYLQIIDPIHMFGNSAVEALMNQLQTVSPFDYELVTKPSIEQDAFLQQNKIRIEEQLRHHSHYSDIDIADGEKATRIAEAREKVLKKYIWAMAYHNRFCTNAKKTNYCINTECNCDTRFLRTVINVIAST